MKMNAEFDPMAIAEIKLSYGSKVKAADRPQITCSFDAARILREHWDADKIEFIEEFKILLLNRSNRVLGICAISSGGVSGTVADPKLIFAAALKSSSSALVLAHNHPSGNLKCSHADVRLTQKIIAGGKFLVIAVLDHIILTRDHYYSFADEGKLQ